jgi:hypothetical protein
VQTGTADAPRGVQRFLGTVGTVGAAAIRLWLRLVGRTVEKSEVPWLLGPIGPDDIEIGARPYELVAEREGLTIDRSGQGGGLVPDFDVLVGSSFDATKADGAVRHFYEHTSRYDLDGWSESPFPGRLFLWLIVHTVSRAMNQLNFPVFGLDLSRGMTSEVLPLRDASGRAVHTGWYRRVKGSGRVIYTGFYTTVKPPGHDARCVKVVFPLPSGNATVILKPGFDQQGRFTLASAGSAFGDAGFYRVLELDERRLKVKQLRSLQERFTVYRDDAGELRCDHLVRFLGLTMLRLHYRMRERSTSDVRSG